jgi:hypothetical protein
MLKNKVCLFIIGLLTSALLLEGGVRVASPLLGPPLVSWNTMEDAKRLKLDEFKQKYGKPNFVFMGNSTTLIGVDTIITDKYSQDKISKSFNAGMNGANIVNMRDFAISYIIPEAKPKNLVLLFSNTGMLVDSSYKKYKERRSVFLDNFQLFSYRNTLRDPMTLNTLLRVIKFRDTKQGIIYRWSAQLNDFGFQTVTNNSIDEKGWSASESENIRDYKIDINEDAIKYLTELRDFAKTNDVKLIIGTVPTLTFSRELRKNIERAASILKISFIQGNDAVRSGDFFQDGTHLNYQGRVEFSEFLGKSIQKIENLP